MSLCAQSFDLQRLDEAEAIMVRLASFATNTHGVASIATRLPKPSELASAMVSLSTTENEEDLETMDQETMGNEILDLASESEGLFFYVNESLKRLKKKKQCMNPSSPETVIHSNSHIENNSTNDPELQQLQQQSVKEFWAVEDRVLELFQRLATIEAMAAIEKADANRSKNRLYPRWLLLVFRFLSSAGACAFWFSGSWADIAVGGACGVVVGIIAQLGILTREERIIFEAVASFAVGYVTSFTYRGRFFFWNAIVKKLRDFTLSSVPFPYYHYHLLTDNGDFSLRFP